MSAATRATRLVVAVAVPPAVVVGLILGFTVGWIAGLVALVVVGASVAAWARFGGDRRVAGIVARPGVRPADRTGEARLYNLVEGLTTTAGVSAPRLYVVESPGLNAMVAGTDADRAVLAVTSGLLAELDRIELEAVVASQLWLIRHDETRPATVLLATFGLGRGLALPPDLDSRIDRGAVDLTRYPPALASALEKMDLKGTAVAGQNRNTAHLWLADPRPPAAGGRTPVPGASGRRPLSERVEALREL